MPVFSVVFESKKEVVVLVEAPDRETAEMAVLDSALSGALDGDGWEYTETYHAELADDDPQYVVKGDVLERKDKVVP